MVTLVHTTPPRLDAPAYAAASDGTMIHRYMDTGFTQQFLEEARRFDLPGTQQQAWRQTDQFGKHANGLPTLRLPVHKTFHMVCVEASCDELGQPALDPRRVASAGFVVRRGTPAAPLVWQVSNGVALGWRTPAAIDADPDERRRLFNAGLLTGRSPKGQFSGEETYPLRPILVDGPVTPGSTKMRKRTLLHGLLPLSGQAPVSLEDEPAESAPDTVSGRLAEHEWPFGSWDGTDTDTDPTTDSFVWTQRDGLQILNGRPERPIYQLLRTLIERYHIHDDSQSGNGRLRQSLTQIDLRTGVSRPDAGLTGDLSLAGTQVERDLLDYIESRFDDLVDWFAEQELALRADPSHSFDRLPGLVAEDLYVTEAQALDLREALVQRGDAAEQDLAKSMPMPRYLQGPDEIYFVRSFLRYLDDCGCERMVWGPDSKPFRVTSPLDPEATPPNVIQMPDLDDVKRGMAKGVTFLTPKSLMDALDKINPDMNFEKKKGNPLSVCLSFSLSFSIPIITICAMILLMIVINLLNFFLRWLPWAFLRLSLKCK